VKKFAHKELLVALRFSCRKTKVLACATYDTYSSQTRSFRRQDHSPRKPQANFLWQRRSAVNQRVLTPHSGGHLCMINVD